ncbi:MAG: cation transporter [Treponema sp.]|jgi:copper ion binding protein|nr:cation transporter [Treponema sp.]
MKTTVYIKGMSCEHCVQHVAGAINGIHGVTSATVSLKDKKAVVEHKDGVTLDHIKAAVAEAGYEVTG